MSDADAPPLWAVLGSLGNIILSVAMMWYILLFLSSCSTCPVQPLLYLFLIAFGAIIVFSVFELFRLLFSERKKSSPAGSLVAKVIEIEARVD
jgi:chromate transport protein ChrA